MDVEHTKYNSAVLSSQTLTWLPWYTIQLHNSQAFFLYDLVYNPPKTLFYRKERVVTIQTDLDAGWVQAEESWRIWNNAEL